ncbi:MAG: glycosyltransferase N-terminal domain-containing protein [Bacteroidota bacterium]
MKILYDLGIYFYYIFIRIGRIGFSKARLWIDGRKNWQQRLVEARDMSRPCIWFHCASLGEFEQGRNLIEAIREHAPHYQLILSFFSPSGYEIRKNYAHVDHVCYLPLDTAANARNWVQLLQPEMVFVVKYELWLNLFGELKKKKIPLMLVSARVRKTGNPYSNMIRKRLYQLAFSACTHIFAQDEQSAADIQAISPDAAVSVSYDTRFDQVWSTREAHTDIPELAAFKKERLCIVCGSTWPRDEALLFGAYTKLKETVDLCLVIAPHEIHQARINKWTAAFPQESIRFSDIDQLSDQDRILWIDNIGMLSRLYAYADIALIGGAWKKKVHNILEAVVFGCPVIFGPNHQNLPEATDLIRLGGAHSVNNESELLLCLDDLLRSADQRAKIRDVHTDFVKERLGATEFILNWCKKAGFLTSTEPI